MPETYANIPLFMAQFKIILPLLILFIVVVIAIISIMQLHENTKMNKSNTKVHLYPFRTFGKLNTDK